MVRYKGKEYPKESFPADIIYMIEQMNALEIEIKELNFKLDQRRAADMFFQGKVAEYLETRLEE